MISDEDLVKWFVQTREMTFAVHRCLDEPGQPHLSPHRLFTLGIIGGLCSTAIEDQKPVIPDASDLSIGTTLARLVASMLRVMPDRMKEEWFQKAFEETVEVCAAIMTLTREDDRRERAFSPTSRRLKQLLQRVQTVLTISRNETAPELQLPMRATILDRLIADINEVID